MVADVALNVLAAFVPDGDEVPCAEEPCNVTKCDEDFVSCVDYKCGGCNAIFFNATGHQVCAERGGINVSAR